MESYNKLKIENKLNGYMLDEVNYNEEKFTYIYVRDEKKKKKVIVTFSLVCHGIKITSSESDAGGLTSLLQPFKEGLVYQVLDSNYLKEFYNRSSGMYDEQDNLKHYLIYSQEDILEVITRGNPIFEEME